VKKKLAVLREHCRDVGRDYNSILKTKLGTVTIDKDRAAARKRVEERFKGAPEQMVKEFEIYGNPEDVRHQVEGFRDVGIEYVILSFEPQRELEAMNLFAVEVVRGSSKR
jgi:alkanesulfonate monooxygenase SsuD/methylene tetrahydromethanopterin reductase-like flavin-dependent oxidoreductase (luciferase family)